MDSDINMNNPVLLSTDINSFKVTRIELVIGFENGNYFENIQHTSFTYIFI